MPIYEYQCEKCLHELEVLQKMSDDPLVHCPDCGEPSLQKELSAPKFRLKGQGWYETDFKTGDKKNIAGDGDKAAKGGDSGSADSKGGDSKPASTTGSGKSSGSDSKSSGNSSSSAAAN